MGSPATEQNRDAAEGPVHEVCVERFAIGKYEVTQGQWIKVMFNNLATFKNGDNYPVERVSWSDTQDFLKTLNAKSGKSYRLPTEAEWEYAARGGTGTARYWGENPDDACEYANVHDTTSKTQNIWFSWVNFNCNDGYGSTSPVGSFKPNGYGLYDMMGNVMEWCQDWYSPRYYQKSPLNNPTGPEGGTYHVLRGGSWGLGPGSIRSAARNRDLPDNRNYNLGFRVVLPLK